MGFDYNRGIRDESSNLIKDASLNTSAHDLPDLTPQAQAHTETLQQRIQSRIEQSETQTISFCDYMQQALYAPEFGYYQATVPKIGAEGDFVTAPSMTQLFGETWAQVFNEILTNLPEHAGIIEFGAGHGQFAKDCLIALARQNRHPAFYYIIELSPALIQRQKQYLQQHLPDELMGRITWLNQLPTKQVDAIVFANEVLDAMPVERFEVQSNEKWQRLGVQLKDNAFNWANHPSNEIFQQHMSALQADGVVLSEGQRFEFNPWIDGWLSAIDECLNSGVILLCDYGYHRQLYYQSDRYDGTLQCYYQHRVHSDPFIYVGLQDITAHVDFTHVAQAADHCGWVLDGYTTQGSFLQAAGISQLYAQHCAHWDTAKQISQAQQVKQLTLGTDLAENFKVIGFSKGYESHITAFEWTDSSYLL